MHYVTALLPSKEKTLWSKQVKLGNLNGDLPFTHCNIILISLYFKFFSPCGFLLGMYRVILQNDKESQRKIKAWKKDQR
jgi:tmRNA-binding protein